jgi:moderate conductance mechanosensitive channel
VIGDASEWLRRMAEHGEWLPRLGIIVLILVVAMVAQRALRRLLRRSYWRRAASGTDRTRAEDLRRTKRQQTVLTVLESLNRYVIYGAAAFMALWVATAGAASAVFGGALVLVLAGFVFQRLLWDIVAGGLLLFEGPFGVGDFVHFHVINVAGVIETFGLRSTTLRTLDGDQVTLLNGNITAFTRYANGYLDYRIRFTARAADTEVRIGRVIERMAAPARPFLLGPHVERMEPATDGPGEPATDVELRAVVAPSTTWLVEESLRAALESAFEDVLEGCVDVYRYDARAFDAYRASILLEQPGA